MLWNFFKIFCGLASAPFAWEKEKLRQNCFRSTGWFKVTAGVLKERGSPYTGCQAGIDCCGTATKVGRRKAKLVSNGANNQGMETSGCWTFWRKKVRALSDKKPAFLKTLFVLSKAGVWFKPKTMFKQILSRNSSKEPPRTRSELLSCGIFSNLWSKQSVKYPIRITPCLS